ncbi:SWIM zinc finger domain protein [Halococcus hamelinensis 100A6]|uniref:SWIM zinc finger domain protein n=1 Tax=Halococcus hamelinensis 100A6 TaxID=1132509 RepID=M0M6W1_9EURY|nr:SWIM zinc finger domain protein [Halococcus hamelinensis 100A6]
MPGAVRVENTSYGDDSGEHVYVVSVESGIPFDCTCPSWKYHNPEDGCKHMLAVENQPAVLMASSSDESPVLADGGERQ